MPSKKQQLLNEALQKKVADRGIVFSPPAQEAMAAYEAWEKFDRLFPSVGKTRQIVSLGSVGLRSGRSHGVGPYESDESLGGIRLKALKRYLERSFETLGENTPVLLNQLRSFILSLYADSMDDKTWKATVARALDQAVITQSESEWLAKQVEEAGSVGACYRRLHVGIHRAHEQRDGFAIGQAYARLHCLESTISSLLVEYPTNLSDVMTAVFAERGIQLPKDHGKRAAEMMFSVGSSLNIHHAAFEVLLEDQKGDKQKKKKAKRAQNEERLVLVPEGSFEQNIIDPEFFGGRVCLVPTGPESGYKLTARAMEATLKAHPQRRFACVMLISPTNPLGLIYTKKELSEIGKVAVKYGLKIICDEHFAGLHYDPKARPVSIASLTVEVGGKKHALYDHTLTIQGMSKLFDDEYRKGGIACCGDKAWVAQIKKVLRQKGAEPSLDDVIHSELVAQQNDLVANRTYLAKQFKLLQKALAHANRIAGEPVYTLVAEPECGFFTVIAIPRALGEKVGIRNHYDFCQYVLMGAPVYARSIQGMAFKLEDRFALRINFGDAIEKHLFQAFTGLGEMAKAMIAGTAPSLAKLRAKYPPPEAKTSDAPAKTKQTKPQKQKKKR